MKNALVLICWAIVVFGGPYLEAKEILVTPGDGALFVTVIYVLILLAYKL